MGDVKLATSLGWLGIPALITGTLLGFAMGATYRLLVIATGPLRWRQQFAFCPFMSPGAIVALLMRLSPRLDFRTIRCTWPKPSRAWTSSAGVEISVLTTIARPNRIRRVRAAA